jgi:hypothetical protein
VHCVAGINRSGLVRRAVFDRNLHSRMPLVPTPARVKRACMRPMAFLSGVHFLTGSHWKLDPNTKGNNRSIHACNSDAGP